MKKLIIITLSLTLLTFLHPMRAHAIEQNKAPKLKYGFLIMAQSKISANDQAVNKAEKTDKKTKDVVHKKTKNKPNFIVESLTSLYQYIKLVFTKMIFICEYIAKLFHC